MQENKIIREVKKQRPYRFSKESEGGPGSKSYGGERELVLKDPTSSCKSVGSWPLASQAFLQERKMAKNCLDYGGLGQSSNLSWVVLS